MQEKRVLPLTLWSARSFWSIEPNSLIVLILSLSILGVGDGLLVVANLGCAPWTVLAQGITFHFTALSIGMVSLIISIIAMVICLWLKQRVGIGTILNMLIIPIFLDLTTHFISTPESLLGRIILAVIGIIVFGVGSAFYLTCHQGAGPRDGLMIGLCRLFNLKIGTIRTFIEVTVFVLGFILGGVVGIGSILFAFGVGWILQITLVLMFRSPRISKKG